MMTIARHCPLLLVRKRVLLPEAESETGATRGEPLAAEATEEKSASEPAEPPPLAPQGKEHARLIVRKQGYRRRA